MTKLPEAEKSLWREAYPGNTYPELAQDIEVDVVIVGAGITGLTCAYLLKKAGLTVAVLDKDTVGGGTTGRTTGKVTSQHGLTYASLHEEIGKEHARLYGEANESAVNLVEQIIKKEKIDCDWERDDNYVYTADAQKVKQFKQETKIAASYGLPASFETKLPLPFPVKGAVKFANQGKLAAQKYVLGLAKAVHGNGSAVYESSEAIGIRDGQPCRVSTTKGKVLAKHIIVATNVPTLPLVARGGYCILEYPTESYIVSAAYDRGLKGMYISPDKDHYSILPITFNGERKLLIGGGGHLSGMRLSKDNHFTQLALYAEKQFGLAVFDHKWSDRDYIAYDKIPLIGRMYPWSNNLYVATAFRKWGLSNGTAAGMILTDIIINGSSKYEEVFTPQRSRPVTSIPSAVKEQAKLLASKYL